MSEPAADPAVAAGAEDAAIVVTLDGIWAAAGVGSGDVTTSEWTIRTPDTGPCAAQPDENRWYAYRISRLPGERREQQPLFAAVDAWLTTEGFDVGRYRAPLSGRLELRAHRDALTVSVAVSSNGATSVQVFAGPCARFIGDEPPTGLEPLA